MSEDTYSETKQIINFVQARFGISYRVAGMAKWLHGHHFDDQKPTDVPHKFDVVKQQDFIEACHELKVSLSPFYSWMQSIQPQRQK